MSRLIMFNIISVDGLFEGKKSWALDWHRLVVDQEFNQFAAEQLRSADRLLFGRITFEGMAAHWLTAHGEIARLMNEVPKFVFSRSMPPPTWENTTLITENAAAEILKLKRAGDRNSFVLGSAGLSEALMREGLFDEYRLLVAPTILGNGRRLFERGLPEQTLKLLEMRAMKSGGVILRYEPVREQ